MGLFLSTRIADAGGLQVSSVVVKSYRKEREKGILDGLQKGLEKVGRIVEKEAAKNIVKHSSKTPWKKTGQIAASVTHELEGNTVIIGTNEKVGRWLELGHPQHPGQFVPAIGKRLVASDVPPYPWLFPAVEIKKPEIIDILKNSGAKGVSISEA